MARGSKTNDDMRARVIELKINTPDITLEQIKQATGLSISTIADILAKEIPEVRKGSENVVNIISKNNNLIAVADALILEKIEAKEERISIRDLVSVRDSCFKQNQLLTGQATENVNVLDMSEEQKQVIAQRWINKN